MLVWRCQSLELYAVPTNARRNIVGLRREGGDGSEALAAISGTRTSLQPREVGTVPRDTRRD